MKSSRINSIFILLLAMLLATGCVSRKNPEVDEQHVQAQNNHNDPYESYNRSVYKFNTKLDKYILRPLAKAYREVTPNPVEDGIHKFFENLSEPRTVVNSLLQGKFDKAGISTGRFVINTTVGVLGFFDVAGKLDIQKQNEDFGQTLATWGVPSGPYLVLPVFGPRYLRHSVGMIPDMYLSPEFYIDDNTVRYSLMGLRLVKTRARLLGTDDLLELQLDPYVFVRESYLQRRQVELNDSQSKTGIDDDEFEDEFDDEFDEDFENET